MNQRENPPLNTSPDSVNRAAGPECPIFDIRSPGERLQGSPGDAIPMSLEELLQACEPGGEKPISCGFIICGEGVRSLKAVKQLRKRGFTGFSSVTGGFKAWKAVGLPANYPDGLDASQADRYARHLVMPQVGPEGQQKLLRSRILLAGLGGLNSPVALYLAAAGVGTLGLVDFDRVERSNLQRQVIHGESGLGELKVESAKARLKDLNPDIQARIYDQHVTPDNADDIIEPWDIVVDGTDSFTSRYTLNDACIRQSKPLVYGAVMRFQGQVSVFWPAYSSTETAPCFRCLMPREPSAGAAPGCAEAGVLGIMPGIVGTLQAAEALKLALGIGQPLVGKLLMIDSLNMEFRKTGVTANPACSSCGSKAP